MTTYGTGGTDVSAVQASQIGAANGIAPLDGASKVPAVNLPANVASLNTLTGAVTLAAGSNVTLTPAGNTVTIASTASGGGIGAVLFDSTLVAVAASIDTGAGGIAGGYRTLEIYIYARTTEALVQGGMDVIVNNDSGANYDRILLLANGTSVSAVDLAAQSSWGCRIAGGNAGANVFSAAHFTFPNYAGTSGFKTGTFTSGIPDTTAGNQRYEQNAVSYRSTSALSRLKMTAQSGANFAVGTRLLILGY